MRKLAKRDGVSVKAYSGSTGVLLAMNVSVKRRKGLLGFAIERVAGGRDKHWLSSMLHFPGVDASPGTSLPTNRSPIQKFRWSDYTVAPDKAYAYSIHPVYGDDTRLVLGDGVDVKIDTLGPSAKHYAIFNRAAAASQAFSREFPLLSGALKRAKAKGKVPFPDDAFDWLSRGLKEQIISFLERAKDEGWALDVAIYEYELHDLRDAIAAAAKRGVKVRIVFHAKGGDPQTKENEESLKKPKLPARVLVVPRITNNLMHDKFVVLSKVTGGARKPQAVLCGSTNWTENGVYRQANVVHIARDVTLAREYLKLFEVLVAGTSQSDTKKWINANNPIDVDGKAFAGFSPRGKKPDIDAFVKLIDGAKEDLLFSTAFALHPKILSAIQGQPHDTVLRYGIQNVKSGITGVHADRTARFVVPALVNNGLDGWIKESWAGQRGNIHIHTKAVVINFTSDKPTVISGSHNLSNNASASNDENFLVLRDNRDVADVYGCEIMRLYDHYRFRFRASPKGSKPKGAKKPKPFTLCETDEWTNDYFEKGSLKCADRERFGTKV